MIFSLLPTAFANTVNVDVVAVGYIYQDANGNITTEGSEYEWLAEQVTPAKNNGTISDVTSPSEGQTIQLTKLADMKEMDGDTLIATWTCIGYKITSVDGKQVQKFDQDGKATYTVCGEDSKTSSKKQKIFLRYVWTRTAVQTYNVTYDFNQSSIFGATIYPVVDTFHTITSAKQYGPEITTFFASGKEADIYVPIADATVTDYAHDSSFTYASYQQTYPENGTVTVGGSLLQERVPRMTSTLNIVDVYHDADYMQNNYLAVTGFIARSGKNTYYKLTGWKDDNGTTYKQGGTFTITANTTLTAQWEPLSIDASTTVLEAPLLTTYSATNTAVKLSQKLPDDSTWSTGAVTLGEDGQIDYRVTMKPNADIYPAEASQYSFRYIDNSAFAAINVNVTLGDGLKLDTDSEGYSTITINNSLLKPTGTVLVNGQQIEAKVTDGPNNFYHITVKARLNGATTFTLPMEWKDLNNLEKEMTLDFSAKAKDGATSGFTANVTVTGAIDLDKAHTDATKNSSSNQLALLTADQVIRYVLSGDSTWYNKYASQGITGTLQAAADLEKALGEINYTSNTVTSARPRTTLSLTASTTSLDGGGTVTLTAASDPAVSGVKVKCSDSSINVTDNQDGTFTATLPNATVNYTFTAYLDNDSYLTDEKAVTVSVTRYTAATTTTTTTNKTETTTETLPTEAGDIANTQVGEETVQVVSEETVTDPETGTVTTTTEKSDGSTTVVETQTNGTVTTTAKAANGVEAVTVAAPGEPVTAKVTIPEDVEKATVTIPADLGSGIVAMDADTGEIIMLSVLTDDGMAIKLDGSANIILVDNSKDFDDVGDEHWASDAVDFATSHELFNGTSADSFTPDGDMTRAMLMTVLARFDGVDTDSGATWYEAGMNWAVENEITDGSNPDASITREQLVTMLYRYAGSPATSGKLDAYSDAANVSSYAADAMAWAIENGILNGINGSLAPQSTASRAQVAAIFQRLCALLVQ
jgi:hypothetical protein